jgi:hypothetical protein
MSIDKQNPICLYKEGMIKVRESDDKVNEWMNKVEWSSFDICNSIKR